MSDAERIEAAERLIDAAPDLLAACKAAVLALPITKRNYELSTRLVAAILKAEGR